jgi:phosphatidylserine/phosphatidylglycerophosphate/cardiolipin synthase-like enzyme
MTDEPILLPGRTCRLIARAGRAAVVVDGDAYFRAAARAMRAARRQILVLGWDFDQRCLLEPGLTADGTPVGPFLRRLAEARPGLDVRILKWDQYWPVALRYPMTPLAIRRRLHPSPVRFRLDDRHPPLAAHHQKILVVDDRVAFCGGIDFAVDRWDTPAHRSRHPLRRTPWGTPLPARHDVMMAVDGDAAAALGAVARERWTEATDEPCPPPAAAADDPDPWPDVLPPAFRDVGVGVARTLPPWRGRAEVREVEAQFMRAFALARRWIYIENQYFASARVAAFLAARLQDPHGPEVVAVCTRRSPSYFDSASMDPLRDQLVERLRAADRFGRFRAYAPQTANGDATLVHSKATAVDGRYLRIGSANLADRSMGFDTECDVAVETTDPGDAVGAGVVAACHRLWADHSGRPLAQVRAMAREADGVVALFDRLCDGDARLKRLRTDRNRVLVAVLRNTPLVDPAHAGVAAALGRAAGLTLAAAGTVLGYRLVRRR